MWRLLSNISRAFKNHVHSPRPSAGLYVEEEQEALELNEKAAACPFSGRRASIESNESRCCRAAILNSLFVNRGLKHDHETAKGVNESQDINTGRERGDRRQRWSCHHDFWRMFQDSRHVFEAISWGTAVLWGSDLDKRRQKRRLLLRVLTTIPSGDTTIRSIKNEAFVGERGAGHPPATNEVAAKDTMHVVQKAAVSISETETLDSVLKDFQSMCAEYTAKSESILGIGAAANGDYATAVGHLHSSCMLGNMSACFNLGLCYETGMGVLQDLDKARHYYQMAANSGHKMALYNLGLMCMRCDNSSGEANPTEAACRCGCNKAKGLGLLEKAAKLGLAEAQTYLGIHHIQECHDVDKAVPYFGAAADQNDAEAQYFLAICYEKGLGVEVNECRAAQLYSQAASAGHELAVYNLAVFNEYGFGGLPQDKAAALELYQKSAVLGCEQAKQRLEEMQTSETDTDWKSKVKMFRELCLQLYQDGQAPSGHQASSLSPSASSPNLTGHSHKDTHFIFSTPPPQDKRSIRAMDHRDEKRTALTSKVSFHLGSDGDEDEDSGVSHGSERSYTDESFDGISDVFSSLKHMHKSLSQPNFSLGT